MDRQKLTSALADATRFSIYQYVSESKQPVTVQDIARQFSIHPNVARLHLTKLEDVDLLKSFSEKNGKGGRPSRLYSLSDQEVSLHFPPRDYQLLSDLAIESLLSLGDVGESTLINTGHRMGQEFATRALQESPLDPSVESTEHILQHINQLLSTQGLQPEMELISPNRLRFRVFNCTFSETAKRFSHSICKLHNALLTGIFETYFGEIDLQEEDSMLGGCRSCNYTVIRVGKKTSSCSS